jgi:hypothetical protein
MGETLFAMVRQSKARNHEQPNPRQNIAPVVQNF